MYFDDKFSDRWLKFDEFCISESLRLMYINYGTDLSNKEWNVTNDEKLHWTFFRFEEYFYCVTVEDDGQVAFATSVVFDKEKLSRWRNVPLVFRFDEKKTSSASKVFSFALFVIVQGCKEFNINEFFFRGQNPSLGKIYSRMVYRNK